MNTRWTLPLAMVAMLVAGGCSRASVKTPVAGTIPDLDEDALKVINGRWGGDGYLMATRVKDAHNAIVEVVLIPEGDEIRVVRFDAVVRETPAGLVASYKEEGIPDYSFVRFVPGANWITIFPAEVDTIRSAVRAGTLKGAAVRDKDGKDTDDVLLDGLGPEEFARGEKVGLPPGAFFHRDPAVILTRVSKLDK